MATKQKQITLKLLIDKKKNRVVFAESDGDFVDILFSFLTMPMGTIIRLLGKKSTVGCMDTLYKSVESIDDQFLRAKICKKMLLHSGSESQPQYKKLAVNIDNTKPTIYYLCSSWSCTTEAHCLVSCIKNERCLCGEEMNLAGTIRKEWDSEKGVFVKGKVRYMISDDLLVFPVSIRNSLYVLNNFKVKDVEASFEERTVKIGADEVLFLLSRSLISAMPLTDTFLPDRDSQKLRLARAPPSPCPIRKEAFARCNSKKSKIKLMLNKSNKKVVCAEVREDFVDLIFSFLTYPIGSIVRLLGSDSSITSMDNLYKSAVGLRQNSYMKSKRCADRVLYPMIPPDFGAANHTVQIAEALPRSLIVAKCSTCFKFGVTKACSHEFEKVTLKMKKPTVGDEKKPSGGRFVKENQVFVVTDELEVKPLSLVSALDGLDVPVSDLEEWVISVGEKEALAILKASMISKTPLTHVFSKYCKNSLWELFGRCLLAD